jgi:DNA-binding NarL/FixJ family response regulator
MLTTQTAYIEPLTARERQIAEAIARGLSNKQIAIEFGISTETVKRHLASIYSKLALQGRVALAIHVIRAQGGTQAPHASIGTQAPSAPQAP